MSVFYPHFRKAVTRPQIRQASSQITSFPPEGSFWRTALLTALLVAILIPCDLRAQVDSGSNGSDGAFNPTQDTVVNMTDHAAGIYQYTTVNIPAGVHVSFISNAANTPVIWLVQGNCNIIGVVSVIGGDATGNSGGKGGPGGFNGGDWITSTNSGTTGSGPGGGALPVWNTNGSASGNGGSFGSGLAPYGNKFLLPLLGGSGGSAGAYNLGYASASTGGGGGGGAILIASSASIVVSGMIIADGGGPSNYVGARGSGGAIRLISNQLICTGTISSNGTGYGNAGGEGRIRIDSLNAPIAGTLIGVVSQGCQPIIIPAPGQIPIQLGIQSVAGIAAPAMPGGVPANPDLIIPGQQANPVQIVVSCANVPPNTEVTVTAHPVNGIDVSAVGITVGSFASSTATLSLNLPLGGGIIYAKIVNGLAGLSSDNRPVRSRNSSIADTGWAMTGERFSAVEVTATFGGRQRLAYIADSGRKYFLPAQ